MSDEYLDDMMNQAPGAINFTMFLTLFGERLQGTDPEDVIRNAFACFDDANVGELESSVKCATNYVWIIQLTTYMTSSGLLYWLKLV